MQVTNKYTLIFSLNEIKSELFSRYCIKRHKIRIFCSLQNPDKVHIIYFNSIPKFSTFAAETIPIEKFAK